MPYTTIKPPFTTLKFEKMSKAELKDYYRWFLLNIPERIQELTSAVKETPGFESWEPDYTRSSLEMLGAWFKDHAETRPGTPEELEELRNDKFWSGPFELYRQLTNKTISLAMDMAMYLSQVLLRNHPTLQWEQPLSAKKYIDYGQPVLGGFPNKTQLNPVRIMLGQAYEVTRYVARAGYLTKIYDNWSQKIHGQEKAQNHP